MPAKEIYYFRVSTRFILFVHLFSIYCITMFPENKQMKISQFSSRSLKAIHASPMQDSLYKGTVKTHSFSEGLHRVKSACQEKNICHHDQNHFLRVFRNMFTLKSAIDKDIIL